ncbi:hypothetical protein BC829DRAFT_446034 [Chytridium lagenaria]|nr:hypothetical protein BC829DRAFT_446034 [Chytridium lagenaria]
MKTRGQIRADAVQNKNTVRSSSRRKSPIDNKENLPPPDAIPQAKPSLTSKAPPRVPFAVLYTDPTNDPQFQKSSTPSPFPHRPSSQIGTIDRKGSPRNPPHTPSSQARTVDTNITRISRRRVESPQLSPFSVGRHGPSLLSSSARKPHAGFDGFSRISEVESFGCSFSESRSAMKLLSTSTRKPPRLALSELQSYQKEASPSSSSDDPFGFLEAERALRIRQAGTSGIFYHRLLL